MMAKTIEQMKVEFKEMLLHAWVLASFILGFAFVLASPSQTYFSVLAVAFLTQAGFISGLILLSRFLARRGRAR